MPSDTPAHIQASSVPDEEVAPVLLVSNSHFEPGKTSFRCHAAGCYLFRSGIPLFWGLVKHIPSIAVLVCVCRLLCRYVGSMATGTGAENLYRSILNGV